MGALLLGMTLAVEAAIACTSPARRDVVPAGIAANLVTHPLATFALEQGGTFWPVELCVAAVEVVAYRVLSGVPWRDALVLSLACNGATIALSFCV